MKELGEMETEIAGRFGGDMKVETEVGRKCRTVALVSLGFIHVPDVLALVSA